MAYDLAARGIYGFATSENLRFADVDANGHIKYIICNHTVCQ